MQLRAEIVAESAELSESDVSKCFLSILHESRDVTIEMVSFAWSPNENGQFFDISGFIRAQHGIRTGTLDAWFRNDQIANKIWIPCICESAGQVWVDHPLITEYLTKSISDGRNREFLRWDAEISKLVPCDGMPAVSKGGRPPKKTKSTGAALPRTVDSPSISPKIASDRLVWHPRKASQSRTRRLPTF